MEEQDFRYYQGLGETAGKLPKKRPLPGFKRNERWTSPRFYIADQQLRDAVNVAILLGQPLLVTGEPGTGKTQLAFSIAEELDLAGPFVFNTKTTSVASDLFYAYDAMRHFQESQITEKKRPIHEYVAFHALGLAILSAGDPERSNHYLREEQKIVSPKRSLVLIDEIDKAPRDLPNDVLDEIEHMRFRVPELDESFEAKPEFRPVLVLTSNSEKDLPEPFLRRCVYYHIEFPDEKALGKIMSNRMPAGSRFTEKRITEAIQQFFKLREQARKKKPATAELLAWLQILEQLDIDPDKPGHKELLALSYSALFKDKDDLKHARDAAK